MQKKKLANIFLPTIAFLWPFVTTAQRATQTIVFDNLRQKEGKIYIAWYNKEEDFTKEDKIFLAKEVTVNNKSTVTVVFESPVPGNYAVAAFLDENGNGKMDTNLFGIPKEKYGFSNNVRPLMRAATFKEASFKVTSEHSTMHIRLK